MLIGNVLFDFQASATSGEGSSDDIAEVDLHIGEVVEILEMYDDGWWLVRTSGKSTGLAPSNYMEIMNNEDPIEASINSSPTLPSGWDCAIDAESNEPYYYNASNGTYIYWRFFLLSGVSTSRSVQVKFNGRSL